MSLKTLCSGAAFRLFRHGFPALSKQVGPAAGLGWSPTRAYFNIREYEHPDPGWAARVKLVDLRSDTVTKPGLAMRLAMAEAEVGDDVMGEDPTVNELQEIAANMFGMEAALYVLTGTMGNLISVMVHCRERGDEMIVGDLSHLKIYEQGGSAQLAGVHSLTLTNLNDGTFDLDELESKIRHGYPDPHYPRTRLICVEDTHNIAGGRVLPLTFLQEVRALADRYGLMVHMDGARVMNAAVAQGVAPSTIMQHAHTVSVCLSKGLGAPAGSILAGPKDFIAKALRCRKALGGGLRQCGILAAAGKMGLLENIERLAEDHHNAKIFAQALLDFDPPIFDIDLATVETNIVRFRIREPSLSPSEFCSRMFQIGKEEEAALGMGIKVLMYPYFGNSVRAVWHPGISPKDTQLAIKKMQFVTAQVSEEKLRAQ